MKSPSPLFSHNKKDRWNMERLVPFFLCVVGLATIFTLFFFYSPNPIKLTPIKQKNPDDHHHHQKNTDDEHHQKNSDNDDHQKNSDGDDHQKKNSDDHHHHQKQQLLIKPRKEIENCDLSKGSWIRDFNASRYTNSSCTTIPTSKNCFRHGREDQDFLNWRWKPEQCDVPRFDSKAFLEIVRGKTLAFIGDSVARNHMESLLCLLSQEDNPIDAYKDSEDRNRVWLFPDHDFTLKVMWTKFLVAGEERMVNGSGSGAFDLYLDRIDENWARELHSLDYIVISAAHWFFRPLHLHNGSDIIACVYCSEPNVTDKGVPFAIGMAYRAALNHINQANKLKGTVTVSRTFSPSHFENGFWNTGGSCNRTSPITEKEINYGSGEWEIRNKQVEEIQTVMRESQPGKKFDILDVTRAMLLRPDGHPGAHWGNKWMKGFNDCVHWCLPGPIDMWNDFLLAVLGRVSR